MKLLDNPFVKYSYGDDKTERNFLEVVAVALVAERLGIPGGIVDPAGHNYYFDAFCDDGCSPYDPHYPCGQKSVWWDQIRRELLNVSKEEATANAARAFGLL